MQLEPFLHFRIPTMTMSISCQLFRWPECPSIDYLWLQNFQIHWILVINWNNASVTVGVVPISTWVYHGETMLLSLSCERSLRKNRHQDAWLRVEGSQSLHSQFQNMIYCVFICSQGNFKKGHCSELDFFIWKHEFSDLTWFVYSSHEP